MVEYLLLTGHAVTSVGTALEFYREIALQQYALAILDLSLPDQDGLVLSQYLRNNTDMRIILLTARSTIEDKLIGYNAGADIYLVKPVDFRELSASIDSLLRRLQHEELDTQHESIQTTTTCWTLICNKWTLQTPQGNSFKLTAKEFDFIQLLVSDNKKVATRLALLKSLGYLNNEFGNRSLESLVNRLRRKLNTTISDSPIQTSHGVGYCFSADIVIS
jgi:DNA-binding response OmpR family regulator